MRNGVAKCFFFQNVKKKVLTLGEKITIFEQIASGEKFSFLWAIFITLTNPRIEAKEKSIRTSVALSKRVS